MYDTYNIYHTIQYNTVIMMQYNIETYDMTMYRAIQFCILSHKTISQYIIYNTII